MYGTLATSHLDDYFYVHYRLFRVSTAMLARLCLRARLVVLESVFSVSFSRKETLKRLLVGQRHFSLVAFVVLPFSQSSDGVRI